MSKRKDAVSLKHYIDAIKGRRMSWMVASEINDALGLRNHYSGDGNNKLSRDHCDQLAHIAEGMLARGVKPAVSLLTPHQKASLAARRRA